MKKYSAPFAVDFDITMKCNLRCLHCNVDAGDKLPYEMTTEEVCRVLDEFYNIGTYEMSLTGGEPLMRSDWREIFKHAVTNKAWTVIINTNGILWTDDDIRFVKEECPELRLVISVDGYDAKTYGILRKDARGQDGDYLFDQVMSNIEKMTAADLAVSINYTVTRLTVDNFMQTLELFEHMPLNGFLAIKFFPGNGRKDAHELELDYSQWEDFVIKMTQLKVKDPKRYHDFAISVTCPWEFYVPLDKINFSVEDVAQLWKYQSPLLSKVYRGVHNIGCHAGVTSCAMSPDGMMYPCGTVSAKVPGLECGNVLIDGVKGVWDNSPVLNRFRGLTIDQIQGHCQSCSYIELCGGGCRARAYVMKGSLTEIDPICPMNGGK